MDKLRKVAGTSTKKLADGFENFQQGLADHESLQTLRDMKKSSSESMKDPAFAMVAVNFVVSALNFLIWPIMNLSAEGGLFKLNNRGTALFYFSSFTDSVDGLSFVKVVAMASILLELLYRFVWMISHREIMQRSIGQSVTYTVLFNIIIVHIYVADIVLYEKIPLAAMIILAVAFFASFIYYIDLPGKFIYAISRTGKPEDATKTVLTDMFFYELPKKAIFAYLFFALHTAVGGYVTVENAGDWGLSGEKAQFLIFAFVSLFFLIIAMIYQDSIMLLLFSIACMQLAWFQKANPFMPSNSFWILPLSVGLLAFMMSFFYGVLNLFKVYNSQAEYLILHKEEPSPKEQETKKP